MDTFRRLVAWERRMGIPANRAMVGLYEWAFVVIGPFALVFGSLALIWGFWVGGVLALLGMWWTWTGWRRLVRFVRSRLGDEQILSDRAGSLESSSESRPPGSRPVRLIGGSVLIAAGGLIIVATLAH